MQLGRVTGTVTATRKHEAYRGRKLLLVEILTPSRVSTGREIIAVDVVQAGVGDTVLVNKEGNSTRFVLGRDAGPILDLVIGVVDRVDLSGQAPG